MILVVYGTMRHHMNLSRVILKKGIYAKCYTLAGYLKVQITMIVNDFRD